MLRTAIFTLLATLSISSLAVAQAPKAESEPATQTVGFLVDNSGTFRRMLDRTIRIASGVVESLPEDSAGFLITYTDPENVYLRQDRTSDREMLAGEIENIFVRPGRTAVWDALRVAADHFRKHTPAGGRTLVVFTDGDELGSVSKPEQVIKDLQELNVTVIAVGLAERRVNEKMLDRVVRETSGLKILPQIGSDLRSVSEEILSRIRDGN